MDSKVSMAGWAMGRTVVLLALVIAGAAMPAAVAAKPTNPSQTVRSFTVSLAPGEGRVTPEAFSTPAIVDVTGDGVVDIVVGTLDGRVVAYDRQAERLAWNTMVSPGKSVHSSPTIADVDRDGSAEIIVGGTDGVVSVLSLNGGIERQIRIEGDPSPNAGIFGTPAVADIDQDGDNEIVVTAFGHNVHVFNLDGSEAPGFPVRVYDSVWSSPAVADIDRDGYLEIVTGGDIDFPCPREAGCNSAANEFGWTEGGVLWAFNHDGSYVSGFPVNIPGQTLWSSPALADIEGDRRLEIVIGTGTNFSDERGHRVHAYRPDGSRVPGWPVTVDNDVMASPAIGDLDNDGRNEVAVGSRDGQMYAIDGSGKVLWTSNSAAGNASIADIDGDGFAEVVSARILDGRTGAEKYGFTTAFAAAASAPAVFVAEDGRAHVVSTVGDDTKLSVNEVDTGGVPGRMAWPTFKQSDRRMGANMAQVNSYGFTDIAASVFKADIAWGADNGIINGCRSWPLNFCPRDPLTRGQMASLLAAAIGLEPVDDPSLFVDDDDSVHQRNIAAIARAGITTGCSKGARYYCPADSVTREQMASFLSRALGLSGDPPDAFDDDNDSVHQTAINRLAAAGITTGCATGPRQYCPDVPVTREQVAGFLHRALG